MNLKIKVLGLLFNKNGEILLLEEMTERNLVPKWNFVRGTYDAPSETLDECMRREIHEETGIDSVDGLEKINVIEFRKKDKIRIYHIYKSEIEELSCRKICNNNQASNENILRYKWFKPKSLLEIDKEMWVDEIVWEVSKSLE